MKYTYLVVGMFFFNGYAQSEAYTVSSNFKNEFVSEASSSGVWVTAKPIDKSVEGSKYLFPTWSGHFTIISTKGDSYKVSNLNYNLETKKIESVAAKDSVFQYVNSEIDGILSLTNKYKVLNDQLLLELNSGTNAKLYKAFSVSIQDAVFNPLTQTESRPSRYIQKHSYYRYQNNHLVPMRLKKKEVLASLNDKKELIEKMVSEKHLSYANEDDVILLFNYYNTL